MSATHDNELVQRFQSGDHFALEELWIRYRARIHARINNKIANSSDVPDVGQAVLIKISRGLPRFKGSCKFSTWLYRIITNACSDYLRKVQRATAARVFLSTSRNQKGPDRTGDEGKDKIEDELSEKNPYSRHLIDLRGRDYTRFCLSVARSVLEGMTPRKRKVIQLMIEEGYDADEVKEAGLVANRDQATQIVHDYRERCRKVLLVMCMSRGHRSGGTSDK